MQGPIKWLITLCLLCWENTAAASATYEPIQTDEMLALANSQQITHGWLFPWALRMAVKPSPLKLPCVSGTGQWQQDKVPQPSLPGKERQKKVLLGCINREEHPQHILLCEKGCQLRWRACTGSYFKCFITVRALWELYHTYTGMKNILYAPQNLWTNINLLFSAAHAAGRKGSGEIMRGSWTSQVTAAGRLPQEARERIVCINTATELFLCRSQSTLKSYSLSQRRENLDPGMQRVI